MEYLRLSMIFLNAKGVMSPVLKRTLINCTQKMFMEKRGDIVCQINSNYASSKSAALHIEPAILLKEKYKNKWKTLMDDLNTKKKLMELRKEKNRIIESNEMEEFLINEFLNSKNEVFHLHLSL